jgi:hypothetical protein
MIRVTITKLERDPLGFWTANVSDGTKTVKVDNLLRIWTTPRDPNADHADKWAVRGEVVPEVGARLRARLRAAEAGLPQDESDFTFTPPAPRKTFRDTEPPKSRNDRSTAKRIAEEMAKAGAAAINQERAA